MDTTLTLANGKVVTLQNPDLYQLVARDPIDKTMLDIPNTAIADILDLAVYGAVLAYSGDDTKRTEENRRFLCTQYEVAALCCLDPPLILRGDVPSGALTPRDIHHNRDLPRIMKFFQNGGIEDVPVTTDQESQSGTSADSPSESV